MESAGPLDLINGFLVGRGGYIDGKFAPGRTPQRLIRAGPALIGRLTLSVRELSYRATYQGPGQPYQASCPIRHLAVFRHINTLLTSYYTARRLIRVEPNTGKN